MSDVPETEVETDYPETEAPRDVAIEADKRELYRELRKRKRSPFYQTELRDLFLIAMGIGQRQARRVPLEGERHYLFSRSSLSDEQEWIIKSAAVAHEEDSRVLRDEETVFTIAQEFANAGIDLLHEQAFEPGEPLREFTAELSKLHNE
jgi:hypothetical protein